MSELRIEHLTSPEIADALASGMRTAILPLGATEQHGAHLPLSVDSDHADRLGTLVAERLGDALVLPAVRLGCSAHHLGFSGTLSVRPETLEAVCFDCCESLALHGFRRVLIFSAHIGNYPLLSEIEAKLPAGLADELDVVAFWDSAAVLDAWRTAVAGLAGQVGGHADVAESSIMLALRPEAVRPGLAAAGLGEPMNDALLDRVLTGGVKAVAPNGVLGDPRGMSSDLGFACLSAVADLLAEYATARYRPLT
ncbi:MULTISPECIES: creatininase family protein [Amycolatopsis]|uniref:Creatininase family protein n=1 Tax=Amycolatopsis dendrobii TaxID=2760662 RepID=A0A7W3ZCU2_9PSEU|nr:MULTISPECIES: creatininase family protein [Amycolatopsis]MBB1156208.1 creatininase family protein [Amycolatopsis dendrobii]UKD59706.1 creatininase family protein [Amycolatopsis sp. FU40]